MLPIQEQEAVRVQERVVYFLIVSRREEFDGVGAFPDVLPRIVADDLRGQGLTVSGVESEESCTGCPLYDIQRTLHVGASGEGIEDVVLDEFAGVLVIHGIVHRPVLRSAAIAPLRCGDGVVVGAVEEVTLYGGVHVVGFHEDVQVLFCEGMRVEPVPEMVRVLGLAVELVDPMHFPRGVAFDAEGELLDRGVVLGGEPMERVKIEEARRIHLSHEMRIVCRHAESCFHGAGQVEVVLVVDVERLISHGDRIAGFP